MKFERPYDTRLSAVRDSHYRTPRTLGDCRFVINADPIERYTAPTSYSGVWWFCIAVLAAAAAALVWVQR